MLAARAQHGWASGMAWLTAVAAGRGDGGMRGRVTHHPVVCLAASWLSGSGSRRHSLLRPQLGTPPPDRLTLLHSVGQAPGSAQLREWSRPPDPRGGKSYAGSWPRAASRQKATESCAALRAWFLFVFRSLQGAFTDSFPLQTAVHSGHAGYC